MVYFDWQHILRALSDDQRGKLVLALVDYAQREQMPHFDDPVTAMAWNALWPRLDEDSRRYAETVNKRRDAAVKRWDKSKTPSANDPRGSGMDKYINW
jgi:hypothetical protein